MKRILGLDLGTASIGWAVVNQAENADEKSSIVKIGVRVNPLTTDEKMNFEAGKSITTNADRTLKHGMRINLQRYKLRRAKLIEILRANHIISNDTILSENGNFTTFETYRLRAKAATEEIGLTEFARVLLMINKKRGYKSSRKANNQEEGQLIDGMSIAKSLYDEHLTPGEFTLRLLESGKRYVPSFYRSDLNAELDRIWEFQKGFYPDILTDKFRKDITGRSKTKTSSVFFAAHKIYSAQESDRELRLLTPCRWRVKALSEKLEIEQLAAVICDINGAISGSSGYLGAISDRSKELYFNKQTIGQYFAEHIDNDPHYRIKNQVFYRQDYLDEFETIWETQAKFHNELTPELKEEIRDVIIFYQRKLKSQKGLISLCEFENHQITVKVEGKEKVKTVGLRVCPKSSPLFQEFKILQTINLVEVSTKEGKRKLTESERELLFEELSLSEKLTKPAIIKVLGLDKNSELNYDELQGNLTQAKLYACYKQILEMSGHDVDKFDKLTAEKKTVLVKTIFEALGFKTDFLTFAPGDDAESMQQNAMFKLWHLLYSYEDDNSKTGNEKLIKHISALTGLDKEYATILANVSFALDYGSLSSKAMLKILPYLKEGKIYSEACECAGYRHSAASLTKEEIENKVLKDALSILPKNSLRNPVVEKILNQMINVVNELNAQYGKYDETQGVHYFDEIHIELARELKKSAKEREEMKHNIDTATKELEALREEIQKKCHLTYVSRNDLIRYRLYLELEPNGFKTLYSNTYIPLERVFSGDFDIEHIIPQAKLFDDSFSNKTLELRDINREKSNMTAYDFVLQKYGEAKIEDYKNRISFLNKKGSLGKFKKLMMRESEIPSDFINRDLRDSQYIAKKAKEILGDITYTIVSTTGSITDRLREDWQLINVMQELNWDKYNKLGLTTEFENKDGQKIKRIEGWTKRNDHRHHAMDALTIAFTRPSHIQYLNNLNARSDKAGAIYAIEKKELSPDKNHHLRFNPPMPIDELRAEALKHLSNTLVSIKAKNKVATQNTNVSKKSGGTNKRVQLTPRGQLHNETVYGTQKVSVEKLEAVNASFNKAKIATVCKGAYRTALLARLDENGGDAKKAFTGKNALSKKPIYLNELHTAKVPEKVKTKTYETIFTIRKDITPDLKIEKVLDAGVRAALQKRLDEFDGNAKKAFANLSDNPIWLNKEKGISINRVTIKGVNVATPLHEKKDKDGNYILDADGNRIPTDYVSLNNNHHAEIFIDENGNAQEVMVSFFEAMERVRQGYSLVDKQYNVHLGWKFLFSIKQNEYFVFPEYELDEKGKPTDTMIFNPADIDLMDANNYAEISKHMYRVQAISTKDYFFRHHLETNVEYNNILKGTTWKRQNLGFVKHVVKVRVNNIGQIVSVGEY